MQFKDYYDILGVEPSAGDAEIKTAYRRLARASVAVLRERADLERTIRWFGGLMILTLAAALLEGRF